MARIVKTLIPEQGYPHREHRSKRGRSRAHRAPYQFTRRFREDRAIDQEATVEISSNLNITDLWKIPKTKIRGPRTPARTRAVHRRNLLLRKEALLRRQARTRARESREALKLIAANAIKPAADRRPVPIVPGRRIMEVTREYIKRLVELGRDLAQSARSRVQNGDVGNDDADLVSKAMHVAGYIESLSEPEENKIA